MSDNWIRLVPDDPRVVPDSTRQAHAKARFVEIAPKADAVEVEVFDAIRLFDSGNNFERMSCPSCGEDVPIKWWQDRLEKDYSQGFRLAKYSLPCCRAMHSLNELDYEPPQAFGKFALMAMNPNIGELKSKHKEELERILGVKLQVVYQHL